MLDIKKEDSIVILSSLFCKVMNYSKFTSGTLLADSSASK